MQTSQYGYSKIPFVRIVLAFMAGIMFYHFFPGIPFFVTIVIVSALTLGLFLFQLIPRFRSSYLLSPFWGAGFTLVLFFIGYTLSIQQTQKQQVTGNIKNGFIIGEISEQPTEKEKSVKTVLEIQAIRCKNEWVKSDGKVVLYFQKDERSAKLKNGDRIIFEPLLKDVTNAGNPEEFDYKEYMAFHLITQQAYLKSGKWQMLHSRSSNSIFAFSDDIRLKLLSVLRKNGLEGENFAVASAITLGYTNELDAEVKQSYSATGAMHVLSVSGLHVGIVYIVLDTFLFFLNRKKQMRFLKAVLIIFFLWGYALLTGLSPSVMRAAAMLSFVVAGKAFSRQTDIYNSLSLSAFVLMLFNPFLLFDVGFQLSYLAVLGIVIFHPMIYQWIYVKNKYIDKLWVLTSVGLAAQLTTLPLSLYYFHQFPNYFLLTGYLVIPLSTLIIYLIIFLFVISPWSWGAAMTGKGLTFLVDFMNSSIKFIENLPGALISNIPFNSVQVIISYAAMITLLLFVIHKKILYLRLFLSSFILILVVSLYQKNESLTQRKFYVYNIQGVSAINFIDGNNNVLFSDIEKQTSKLSYALKGNWLSLGVEKERIIPFSQLKEQFLFTNLLTTDNENLFFKKNFFDFYGRRMVNLRESFSMPQKIEKAIPVDYLVLSNNIRMSLADLLKCFTPRQIIFDSSNSSWQMEKWTKEAEVLKIPCHDVTKQGAFIANI